MVGHAPNTASMGNAFLDTCRYLQYMWGRYQQVVSFQQGEIGSDRAAKMTAGQSVSKGAFMMIRSLAATLFALLLMCGLAVSAQADSTPTSGTLTGNTTLTATADPLVFDSSFTGSGVDSASGAFTTTNMGTIIFTSLVTFESSGMFEDVVSGGTLFGTFTGNGVFIGIGSETVTVDLITGGTGIFLGDTGEITVTGTTNAVGAFTGTYTGFIKTPEPSSLALMFAGIGLLPLMRRRLAQV